MLLLHQGLQQSGTTPMFDRSCCPSQPCKLSAMHALPTAASALQLLCDLQVISHAVTCQLWRGKTRCAMLMYAVLPACQTCTAQLQDDHSWRQLKQCRQDPGSCYAANSCCQIILCCQQLLSDHTVVRQCTIWMCCRMVLVAVCLAFLRAKVFLNS